MTNHARHGGLGVYRSAITEADGRAVNVWYFSIYWAVWAYVPVVLVMTLAAVVQAWSDPLHVFPFFNLGTGIGLTTTAFGAALTAIAAAMRGQAGQQP